MGLISEGADLLNLVDKARNVELYRELGEWIEKVRQLQRSNDALEFKVTELREQLRFKASVQRINGHTFVEGDDEEICPRCAEVDRKPVHLLPWVTQKHGMGAAACPQCHTAREYKSPFTRTDALKGSQV